MIEPYYKDDYVTIYNGDCLEIIPQLDMKFDLVLTDPPYGINLDLEHSGMQKWNRKRNTGDIKYTDKIIGDDGSLDCSFLYRFDKRIIWGHPYIYDINATGWLVWDKVPNSEWATLGSPVEMASSTTWKGFRILHHLWNGFYRDEPRYGHPTQKPLRIIKYCLEKSGNNNSILDPFLGSGTTCVAAKQLNRKCVGIEIEEKYCEIAAKRCSQEVLDLT